MSILEKIPFMDDNKLMTLFHNAQRQILLANPNAAIVLEQIQNEWKRRLEQAKTGQYKATMPEKGMLSAFGYCVGSGGIADEHKRQELLFIVFESDLPIVGSPTYTAEWGAKKTNERYKKLRRTLIGLISNNRNFNNMDIALEHWSNDLKYIDRTIQPLCL